jgi:hypothetical protein
MKYVYTLIYGLVGANLDPSIDGNECELIKEDGYQVILAKSVEEHCHEIDLQFAIANCWLNRLFGPAKKLPFTELLQVELDREKARRKDKLKSNLYLVVRFLGETNANPDRTQIYESSEFVAYVDLANRDEVSRTHHAQLQIILCALAIEIEVAPILDKITQGLYFIDELGRTSFSLTLSGTMRGTVTSPFSREHLNRISQRSSSLIGLTDLSIVFEFNVLMLQHQETDPLRAFLFGWLALEVFIKRSFKSYWKEYSRATEQMKDEIRYYLSNHSLSEELDKLEKRKKGSVGVNTSFVVIAGVIADSNWQEDADTLRSLNKIRNERLHGDVVVSESALPNGKLKYLLAKYLDLHSQFRPQP